MQKPASLRAALTAALPELRNSPDRLVIWVEDGAIRARQTDSDSFAFAYPLSILLNEVSTDIAIIAHAINRWLRVNEPSLIAGGAGDSYAFETDILDNGCADIVFTLDLMEFAQVAENGDGSWSIDYRPEPNPLFDDDVPADPATQTATPLTGVSSIVAD